MKSIMLAATALLAMPALAQTMPPAGGTAGSGQMPPPTDSTMPMGGSTMQPGSPPMSGGSMQPGSPPMGSSSMPMGSPGMTMGPMANNPPPAAPSSYPMCSKTVTDACRERNSLK